jgi:hypothetical protein
VGPTNFGAEIWRAEYIPQPQGDVMEKDVKKGERKGKLRAKRFNNGETKIKQMQNGENTGTKGE